MFIDSHCHLALLEPEVRDGVLERARNAGVRGFLVPATMLADLDPAIALAEAHADVWAAAGFHPHEAKDFDAEAEVIVRDRLRHPRVVGVGEIGLDFHYDHSPREVQRDVLLRHLALARESDLPIIVHNRESTDELLDVLSSSDAQGIRGVIHSFTETADVARRFMDLGFLISFSGIVTFRSADSLREAARAVPLDMMLIETDTPFLAPVPVRGKQNEPSFVRHTAELVAGLHGTTAEEVGAATARNFASLFRVDIS